MKQGMIHIYSGDGHGKSPAAMGRAIQAACQGKHVVIIQFLKGKTSEKSEFLKRLEPEIKIFIFEKSDEIFWDLPKERQQEEVQNIKNGMNYARKVLSTGECDVLILDEVLGLLDYHIITIDDLKQVLEAKSDSTDIIMTGIHLEDDVCILADEVTKIETLRFQKW